MRRDTGWDGIADYRIEINASACPVAITKSLNWSIVCSGFRAKWCASHNVTGHCARSGLSHARIHAGACRQRRVDVDHVNLSLA